MKELIKALNVFIKYNEDSATHCEHDELTIVGPPGPEEMKEYDVELLGERGFFWSDSDGYRKSFRHGSC